MLLKTNKYYLFLLNLIIIYISNFVKQIKGKVMSLKNKIKAEIIAAMKAKDSNKLDILRLMSSFISNKEIALGIKGKEDLNDNEVMNILKSMVKSRENAIVEYEKINDTDSIANEKREIEIIVNFLPKPYNESETIAIVENIIKDINANSVKDTGKIMSVLNAREDANKFNKTLVAKIIKEKLN